MFQKFIAAVDTFYEWLLQPMDQWGSKARRPHRGNGTAFDEAGGGAGPPAGEGGGGGGLMGMCGGLCEGGAGTTDAGAGGGGK